MEAHDEVVSAIAARVEGFYKQQKPFRIYHGSTHCTQRSYRREDNTVDTSRLNHVLAVDVAAKTALVEPNVSMDTLVKATLQHGLVPLVVMEFPGITVGGGFSGTSGESSSFRYGPFDNTIGSIEIVLPDGTIARASKKENQDIFWGAASAFGTLGVVTMLEVLLRDAKTYVRLEYSRSHGAGEMLRKIEYESGKQETDYVDAIIFSFDETIVCVGQLTDDKPTEVKPIRLRGRSDPWFYTRSKDVWKQLRKKNVGMERKTVTDYIPLEDYLFRYDRGGFWTAKYAFRYFIIPFNHITRFLLDPLLYARFIYRVVHAGGAADNYMVQDVGVPLNRAEELQTWLDKELHIYPLWICPLRTRRDDADSAYGLHSMCAQVNSPDIVNFGVWGPINGSIRRNINREKFVEKNRALERKVHELGGKKCLYAHAYYTEDEFWAHYDRESYDALREKYKAGYLPSVYDKVRVDVEAEEAAAKRAMWASRVGSAVWRVWPMAGLRGFYSAVKGSEYLMNGTR